MKKGRKNAAKKKLIRKAIRKYGIPSKIYNDKVILEYSMSKEDILQALIETREQMKQEVVKEEKILKVGLRGIEVNGVYYWNEDLLVYFIGMRVRVAINDKLIRIYTMFGRLIATFEIIS